MSQQKKGELLSLRLNLYAHGTNEEKIMAETPSRVKRETPNVSKGGGGISSPLTGGQTKRVSEQNGQNRRQVPFVGKGA